MGHLSAIGKDHIIELIDRLHRYPIGAPRAPEMYEILKILYTEEEALVGSRFPMAEATLEEVAQRVGMDQAKVKKLLESMMDKALVMDFTINDKTYYFLTPTVIGFFEFNFMRVNPKLPQKRLAELMHKYFQDQFGAEYFGSKTPFMRAVASQKSLPLVETQVATHEQVKEIIRNTHYGSLQMCYCRHKAHHLGTICDAPLENICIGLGYAAEFLVRRGFARHASTEELLDVIDRAEAHGLVHLVDNVRDRPTFICNCCSCCCDVLTGIKRRELKRGVRPSEFIISKQEDLCVSCGACAKACPIEVIEAKKREDKKLDISIDLERCIGCGICISSCKTEAIKLVPRKNKEYLPKNNFIKLIKIAYEKGRTLGMLKEGFANFFRGHPPMWKNPFL